MKRNVLAAFAAMISAAPAPATLYIQLQYGTQAPVIVSQSNTASVGFVGTFGASGAGCNAASANCFSLSAAGIDAASASDPGFVTFTFNGSVANVTAPGTITLYVQQTNVSPFSGTLSSAFSVAGLSGSAQKADLYTFLDISQLASHTFTADGTAVVNTVVNKPAAFSETMAYIFTFGSGRGTFGAGASIAAVPEPETWATMVAGFGLIGGALRTRRKATARFA